MLEVREGQLLGKLTDPGYVCVKCTILQLCTRLPLTAPQLGWRRASTAGAKVQRQGARSAHAPLAGWHVSREVGQRSGDAWSQPAGQGQVIPRLGVGREP